MTEDKARDRVDSADSARERNAVNRLREPAVARMGFFNGLLRARLLICRIRKDAGAMSRCIGR